MLLTVLNDVDGGLNPETPDRQYAFRTLRQKFLNIGPVDRITKEALVLAGLLQDDGCLHPSVKLYAATGNHSSYAARLWKRGTEYRDYLNPQLSTSITIPGWNNTDPNRKDVCRGAHVYVLYPGESEEEKKLKLRNLAVMDNRLEELFRPGSQTFAAALQAMRRSLPSIIETIRQRLKVYASAHPNDKAAKAFLQNGTIPWSSTTIMIPFDTSNMTATATISAVLRAKLSDSVERPSKRESIAGGRQPGVIALVMADDPDFEALLQFVRQYEEDTFWDFAVTLKADPSLKSKKAKKEPVSAPVPCCPGALAP
jgi:hypothetical protein